MIKLTENLVLIADEHQYIVTKLDSKGKPSYSQRKYYSSIDTAIAAAVNRAVREGVANEEIQTLNDFIDELNRYKAEFEKLLSPLVAIPCEFAGNYCK